MRLEDYGLNAQLLVAGFFGGVAHAFAFKQTSLLAQVGSVIMGTVTANYIGPAVQQIPHVGDVLGQGGCGFAVGICAMAVIQGIAAAAQSRISQMTRGRGDLKEEKGTP